MAAFAVVERVLVQDREDAEREAKHRERTNQGVNQQDLVTADLYRFDPRTINQVSSVFPYNSVRNGAVTAWHLFQAAGAVLGFITSWTLFAQIGWLLIGRYVWRYLVLAGKGLRLTLGLRTR